jgi:hypothetical protein
VVIRNRLVPSVLVALVALGAAWMALLQGVDFWDTGELQTVGPLLGTAHPTGFPTYVLLGWLASVVLQPLGEPAYRMNLLSAICLAVAAGVTVDLVRGLTGRAALGIAVGIAMALTPIAWAISTHAETHSLHLALVAILLWLLVEWDARVRAARSGRLTAAEAARAKPPGADLPAAALPVEDRPRRVDRGDRYLVAATIVFGLAVGDHSLTLLLAIPVALYVLAVDPGIWRRGRLVLTCVAALAVTVVLVYLELPLRAAPGLFRAPLVYGTPYTWDGFRYIVLAEQFQGSLYDPFGELPRKFGELVSRTVTQFGVLAPLIPLAFLVTVVRRPRYALLTGTAAAITCFFAASYINADINRYYLGPALMAWTWLAILAAAVVDGLAYLIGEPPADASEAARSEAAAVAAPAGVAPPPGAALTPEPSTTRTWTGLVAVLLAVVLLVPTALEAPARFAAVDATGHRDAVTWTDHVLDVMKPDAVIVSWWSYSTPLWYAHLVEGRRPDITIIDDRTRLDENLGELTDVIDANLGKHPVYVIRVDRREVALLAQRYDLEYIDGRDASSLTRVIGLKGGAS